MKITTTIKNSMGRLVPRKTIRGLATKYIGVPATKRILKNAGYEIESQGVEKHSDGRTTYTLNVRKFGKINVRNSKEGLDYDFEMSDSFLDEIPDDEDEDEKEE